MTEEQKEELVKKALEARQFSYAPYSNFRVGAALLSKGGQDVYKRQDVYGPISSKSRSDVNIIATVNPNTKQILLTNTPRDYYVPIPGISGEGKDKLTHAGIYGVEKSMATLGQLYGIEIPFYARVNFTSLITMVDLMGGIDVDSEVAFTTDGAGGAIISVQKGMNHFNGEQALAFARERYSLEGGDNQRGKDVYKRQVSIRNCTILLHRNSKR